MDRATGRLVTVLVSKLRKELWSVSNVANVFITPHSPDSTATCDRYGATDNDEQVIKYSQLLFANKECNATISGNARVPSRNESLQKAVRFIISREKLKLSRAAI